MSTAPISVTSAPSNDKQRLCRHISIKPEHKPIKQARPLHCTLVVMQKCMHFKTNRTHLALGPCIVLECKQINVVTSFESTSVVHAGLLHGPWSTPRPGTLLQWGPISSYIKYFAHLASNDCSSKLKKKKELQFHLQTKAKIFKSFQNFHPLVSIRLCCAPSLFASPCDTFSSQASTKPRTWSRTQQHMARGGTPWPLGSCSV